MRDRLIAYVAMLREETGATMIEYALIVTLVALVAFAAVGVFGINLNDKFLKIAGAIP